MNCRQAETWIVELGRDGALDADLHADALRHLAACPRCTAQLQTERAITADLCAVAAHDAHTNAPAHVEANLLVAFRARAETLAHASAPVRFVKPARTLTSLFFARRAGAAFAVAALVLLTFAVLRFNFSAQPVQQTQMANAGVPVRAIAPVQPAQGPSGAATTTQGEGPPDGSVIATLSVKLPLRADERLSAQVRRRQAATYARGSMRESALSVGLVGEMTVVARAPALESVTEFMPLVANGTPPLTSGQLVRVEVSRAALAALGLPVDMTRAGETMKADVLLGEDGLARAIRLVR